MPNGKVGQSGTFFEKKKEWREFENKNGRMQKFRKDGRFGEDEGAKNLEKKNMLAYEFNLAVGEYKLGKAKLDLSKSGFSFSADIEGPKKIFEINKNISQLAKSAEYNGQLIDALKQTLAQSKLKFDIDRIAVKRIEISGPSAGVGVSLSTDKVGAKASGQIAGISMTLETPLGDISAKLKAGASLGNEVGFATTKAGKPGLRRSQKLAIGMWELSVDDSKITSFIPSLLDWNVYAATPPQYRFEASQDNVIKKLFSNSDLACKFDLNDLATFQSTSLPAITAKPTIELNKPNKVINRSPQGSFSLDDIQDAEMPGLQEIPDNTNITQARAILENNLKKFDLNDKAIEEDLANPALTAANILFINNKLIELNNAQTKMFELVQQQQEGQQLDAAITALQRSANGFVEFGRLINSPILVTVGNAINFTAKVMEVFRTVQKAYEDASALSSMFAPFAAIAPLGVVGAVLGGFMMLMNLFGSNSGPDTTAMILGKLDELLRGQREILGCINTIRDEQAYILRSITQDLEELRANFHDHLNAVGIEFKDAIQQIEASLSFMLDYSRIAARNQYVQAFKAACLEAKSLELTQGREAERITRRLETMLLSDANNEVINGYAEKQANLPKKKQIQLYQQLLAQDYPEESRDRNLNFLLGFLLDAPMVNPLIWQQAAQHYIAHTQRYFALYADSTDRPLLEAIAQGQEFLDLMMQDSTEQQQKYLDQYHVTLEAVQQAFKQLQTHYNLQRKAQHNHNYLKSSLHNEVIDELDFFAPPQQLINQFQSFDNAYNKYRYTFQHLQPRQVGKTAQSVQVSFMPYADKAPDPVEKRSFDINLASLANQLRNNPAQGSAPRSTINLLLAAEYLELCAFVIEGRPMTYPDIPTRKNAGGFHVADIISENNNSQGCNGYYYLNADNVPWTMQLSIFYGEQNGDVILTTKLPTDADIDTLLTTVSHAYLLCTADNQQRVYHLSKYPRDMRQVFNCQKDFFDKLHQDITAAGATRRNLSADETQYFSSIDDKRPSNIRLTISGDYQSFDTKIGGIFEFHGNYREPDDENQSFHKKVRQELPLYIQQSWSSKQLKIDVLPDEVNKLTAKISDRYIQEREQFWQALVTKHSDNSNVQQCLIMLHDALQDLDLAEAELKLHLHINGKKSAQPLLNSTQILNEIKNNIKNISAADIAPSLTKACTKTDPSYLTLKDFVKLEKLSKYHPKKLLERTLGQLQTHKTWRNWMRRSFPWLKYQDLQSLWIKRIYSRIEQLHETIYLQYKDLKEDINVFTFAKARLDHAASTPITNPRDYQKVYNATYDWAIIQSKKPLLTHLLPASLTREQIHAQLDATQLKKGWVDNIACLIQYAQADLDIQIDPNLVNFTLWSDGAVHLAKLLDFESGPYKEGPRLAKQANLPPQTQAKAVETLIDAGMQLQQAIIAVGLSQKLFAKLFTAYTDLISQVQKITQQSASDSDHDIIQAMLDDDFTQGRLFAGSFYTIKQKLDIIQLLLANYISMTFSDDVKVLVESMLPNSDTLETTLRKLLTKPDVKDKSKKSLLQQYIEEWTTRARYCQSMISDMIEQNRSIAYFTNQLEHYDDNPKLRNTDTLLVVKEFLTAEQKSEKTVFFSADHLNLVDQFLHAKPHITALSLIGLNFGEDVLEQLVDLISRHHPQISKVTIAACNLTAAQLGALEPLLPQLKQLDLRGNRLGGTRADTGSSRFSHLIPFLQKATKNVTFIGLAFNQLSAADIAAINAMGLLENTNSKYTLDITGNAETKLQQVKNIEYLNDKQKSADVLKPLMIQANYSPVSLSLGIDNIGRPTLNQIITLLKNTQKILMQNVKSPAKQRQIHSDEVNNAQRLDVSEETRSPSMH